MEGIGVHFSSKPLTTLLDQGWQIVAPGPDQIVKQAHQQFYK